MFENGDLVQSTTNFVGRDRDFRPFDIKKGTKGKVTQVISGIEESWYRCTVQFDSVTNPIFLSKDENNNTIQFIQKLV